MLTVIYLLCTQIVSPLIKLFSFPFEVANICNYIFWLIEKLNEVNLKSYRKAYIYCIICKGGITLSVNTCQFRLKNIGNALCSVSY